MKELERNFADWSADPSERSRNNIRDIIHLGGSLALGFSESFVIKSILEWVGVEYNTSLAITAASLVPTLRSSYQWVLPRIINKVDFLKPTSK